MLKMWWNTIKNFMDYRLCLSSSGMTRYMLPGEAIIWKSSLIRKDISMKSKKSILKLLALFKMHMELQLWEILDRDLQNSQKSTVLYYGIDLSLRLNIFMVELFWHNSKENKCSSNILNKRSLRHKMKK